jgi:tyrosine phenol-lyase
MESNLKNGTVKFFNGKKIPLEMHKVKMVQAINLVPIERRLKALEEAGYNSHLMQTRDIFMDMLTDSGTNAMSDNQVAATFQADEAYAGSESFIKLQKSILEVFGKKLLLPVHQGRAGEHILAKTFVKAGSLIPMNYHFLTFNAHVGLCGGSTINLINPEGPKFTSTYPFKGNMDIHQLEECIIKTGPENIPFIRMEASTNFLGGQPFSMENLKQVRKLADKYRLMIVLDASLVGENIYFIKKRESGYENKTLSSILIEMSDLCEIIYFSARKVSSSRGGMICTNSTELYDKMKNFVPLYEGFLTYGGMSIRDIESMAVGLKETIDENVISQTPQFVEYVVDELVKLGIPVITPGGALGFHVNAMEILDHVPQNQYPGQALAAAFYIASGNRAMESGTMMYDRDEKGVETIQDHEIMRVAVPRRVFTLSQMEYCIDRLNWVYHNRKLVGGLHFVEEPPLFRFFTGKLAPVSDWPQKLAAKYKEDFGNSI